uniref:CUB domain-containing protein n=1 Tax=Magallana gigas TaxID=29159 RepID=K1QCK6_MAGGI
MGETGDTINTEAGRDYSEDDEPEEIPTKDAGNGRADLVCPNSGSEIVIDGIGMESQKFRFPAVGTFGFPEDFECKWIFKAQPGLRLLLQSRDATIDENERIQVLDTNVNAVSCLVCYTTNSGPYQHGGSGENSSIDSRTLEGRGAGFWDTSYDVWLAASLAILKCGSYAQVANKEYVVPSARLTLSTR